MTVSVLLDRLRRRWVLILLVGLVAVAAAAVGPLYRGETWTGTAALSVSSKTRSPEQDAVIARGYVDYFNQPATQSGLLAGVGAPDGVTSSATLAADSPIIYVRAVSPDPATAGDIATRLAGALRDQVRDNLNRSQGGTVNDLKAQLATANARLGAVPLDSPERDQLSEQATDIQNTINELVTNTANQLQDLQPAAGVSPNATDWVRRLGGALAGGLLFGALAALVLGQLEGRFSSASDAGARLGLPVLGTVGSGRRGRRARRDGDGADDRLLRSLAAVASRDGVGGRGVLAVATPAGSRPGAVARGLVALRGRQGLPALLVQADLSAEPDPAFAGRRGVAELLAARGGARLDGVLLADGGGLLVAPAGASTPEGWLLLGRERVADLLDQARRFSPAVVVEAPPVTDDGAGRTVCARADRTVLVVELDRTRVRAATAAVAALAEEGVTPVGVVVVDGAGPDAATLGDRRWHPAPAPSSAPRADAPDGPVRPADPARTGPVTANGRDHGPGPRPAPATPHPS